MLYLSRHKKLSARSAKKICAVTLLLTVTPLAAAQASGSLHEAQTLSFGQIALPDGTAGQTVTVATNGTVTSSGITLLQPRGRYGVYEIEGYTTHPAIYLTIADDTMSPLVMGTPFDVVQFNTLPSCPDLAHTCTTDINGNLEIRIGATLQTRGLPYNPGPYRGTYTLMVNW
jgi:hypothetical protein